MDKATYLHLLITGQLNQLEEPNEFEYIRMMKEQEEKRSEKPKRGKRKKL
jgi:hypothetical protein